MMKVLYSSSLFCEGRGRRGRPQRVSWAFDYAGMHRMIPCVYFFPEGMVFDLLTQLDGDAYQAFIEKYADKEQSLSATERRLAEEEHPFQAVPLSHLTMNGHAVSEFTSSSCIYTPLSPDDRREEKKLRRAYRQYLRGVSSFACERYCVPYPKGFSKRASFPRMGGVRITELSFRASATTRLLPLEVSFSLREGERAEASFTHPGTGVQHTLYVQKMKQEEAPLAMGVGRNLFYAMAMYEITPPLALGERFDFLTHVQFEPEYDAQSDTGYLPQAVGDFAISAVGTEEWGNEAPADACSVGVIGCADGPTAIFVGGKQEKTQPVGENGLPLHVCFAIPTLEPQVCARFQITGIEVPWRGEELFSFRA